MEGWIKLHRKIVNWGWYQHPVASRLFFHLLLKANHEDKIWQGIEVKRGQAITGRRKLAQQLKVSEQSIRSALKCLKSTNELTIKITNRYSLITINNYSNYQVINQQVNQQVTSKQPASNHKQEGKNEKNEKNERKDTPAQKMKEFLETMENKNERYEKLVSAISVRSSLAERIIRAELDKFVNYWSELNKVGTKQRWQMEKTFEVQRRVGTWLSNAEKFSSRQGGNLKPKSTSFIS